MARRAAVVVGVTASLALTACGGDSGPGTGRTSATPSSPSSAAATPSATASAEPTPQGGDGTRVGGEKTGVTLTLPAGWRQVDPTQDASEVVRTSFGLNLDTGELVKQLLAVQVRQGVVFAIDGSVKSGLAPHLSAGCDRGGAIGASIDQLKRKQQALAPGSQITDLTVDGKPAFKATYTATKKSGPVSGMTVRVSLSNDRFCFVDIEARQGAMPASAERIASSFALA